MGRYAEKLKRHLPALLVVLLLLGLFIFVFFIFPPLFITRSDLVDPAQRLTAQNEVRTTALQALAGMVAIGGAYIAYITWKQNRFSAQEQRLADFVKQLRSEYSEVRLAAIDGLQRLALESRTHSQVIRKVRGLHLTGVTPRSWRGRLPRPQHLAVYARLLRSSGDPQGRL